MLVGYRYSLLQCPKFIKTIEIFNRTHSSPTLSCRRSIAKRFRPCEWLLLTIFRKHRTQQRSKLFVFQCNDERGWPFRCSFCKYYYTIVEIIKILYDIRLLINFIYFWIKSELILICITAYNLYKTDPSSNILLVEIESIYLMGISVKISAIFAVYRHRFLWVYSE